MKCLKCQNEITVNDIEINNTTIEEDEGCYIDYCVIEAECNKCFTGYNSYHYRNFDELEEALEALGNDIEIEVEK